MSLDNKQQGQKYFAFELNNLLKQVRQLALNLIDLSNYEDTIVASDTLRGSANTARTASPASYQKVKEIKVNRTGIVRVKFDLLLTNNSYPSAYARIYKNGVAVGTERSTNQTSYQTYSEDIAVTKGDLIQLYYKMDQPTQTSISVQNFRVYYDDTGYIALLPTINTD